MPRFFRPIYAASLGLLILFLNLLMIRPLLLDLSIDVPDWLLAILGTAGSVGAGLTNLTVDWPAKKLRDKVARFCSPWYVSLLSFLAILGAGAGYTLMALAVVTLCYRPVFWLVNRYVVQPKTRRQQQRHSFEPQAITDERRLIRARRLLFDAATTPNAEPTL